MNAVHIFKRTATPAGRSRLFVGVDSLNSQQQDGESEAPPVSLYEAADYNLFYTTASLISQVNMWK